MIKTYLYVLVSLVLLSCSSKESNKSVEKESSGSTKIFSIASLEDDDFILNNIDSVNFVKSAVNFTANNDDPQLQIEVPFRKGNKYEIAIDIEVPNETFIQIFYVDKGNSKGFSRENSVSARLTKGRNVRKLQISNENLGVQLRIDPGNVVGHYSIKSFHVFKQ